LCFGSTTCGGEATFARKIFIQHYNGPGGRRRAVALSNRRPAAAGMIHAPIVNIIAVRQMAARSALVRHCNPAIPRARATDGRHISPRRAAPRPPEKSPKTNDRIIPARADFARQIGS